MTPPTDQTPDPWSLRASDAERDAYLALLREAYAEGRLDAVEYDDRMTQALNARTYRDLYAVLAELPVDPNRVPGPPAQATGSITPATRMVPVPAPKAGGFELPAGFVPENSITAIFSSSKRDSQWVVPVQQDAFALFGEVTIDLTGAVLSGPETVLRCNAVFGSVTVTVPDSVRVDINGTGILGEFERKDKRKGALKERTPAPNAPVLRITGVALLGNVTTRIVAPKEGGPTISMLNNQLPPGPVWPSIEGPPQ